MPRVTRPFPAIALSLLVSLLSAPGFADDKPAKKDDSSSSDDKPAKKKKGDSASADDKPAKKKGDSASAPSGPRRDPKNITGISPFMEKLVKGHKLVVARDFLGAIDAYRAAITEDDKNPLGHYFLASAQLLKGNFTEADASFQTALRSAGDDDNTHGKVLFGLAYLRERQGKFDEAKTFWADYGKFVADHPKAGGYPNTAAEHQKLIDVHNDLVAKYGPVKERIAAREKELKDQANKDAAKDAAEEEKKGGKRR